MTDDPTPTTPEPSADAAPADETPAAPAPVAAEPAAVAPEPAAPEPEPESPSTAESTAAAHAAAEATTADEPAAAPRAGEPEPAAAPKRRFSRPGPRGRAVLRWGIATVLCLGLGTGTAFAVMAPQRTDVPGLATPADGRYAYPALRLPELPPGAVGPSAGGGPSGAPGGTVVHAADTRQLLLPTPVGGVADSAYPGAKGWVPLGDYTKLFTDPDGVNELLGENGVRHVAASGWRMPDGTHVAVYLLAFRGATTCQTAFNGQMTERLAAAPGLDLTGGTDIAVPAGVANSGSRPAGAGGPALRTAIFVNEDVMGLLVMTNPKAVNPVDFDQALVLQMQLLRG